MNIRPIHHLSMPTAILFNQPKNIETRHQFASAQAHRQGRLKSKETLDFQTALNESITQRLQQQQR